MIKDGKKIPCDGELWYRGYNIYTLIRSISKEEYESLLNEISADSLEISTEKNVPDKYVNEDQQAVLEQEFMMEEALDEIKGQISIDFCGENSKYIVAKINNEINNDN